MNETRRILLLVAAALLLLLWLVTRRRPGTVTNRAGSFTDGLTLNLSDIGAEVTIEEPRWMVIGWRYTQPTGWVVIRAHTLSPRIEYYLAQGGVYQTDEATGGPLGVPKNNLGIETFWFTAFERVEIYDPFFQFSFVESRSG